jgi:hypothetical protein
VYAADPELERDPRPGKMTGEKNPEPVNKDPEPGKGNAEPGKRNSEPGKETRNPEKGTRKEEQETHWVNWALWKGTGRERGCTLSMTQLRGAG